MIAYRLVGYEDILLASTTSNVTEHREEPTSVFLVDVDDVMFQLIQSKAAKLVVWVPGLVV